MAIDLLDPSDGRSAAVAALCDWLALQGALALHPGEASRLLRATGGPVAALAASGQAPPPRPLLEGWIRVLRQLEAVGVPFRSAPYPGRLARLSDPPPLLWVRGRPEALSQPAVAIVGSRAATVYGLSAARRFAGELARAGLTIVSGLAWGIDAAAHRAALDAGGRTLAVQACGLDCTYPAAHRTLADEIARSGAVLTELPPGVRPRPPLFPLRNRLISGLACAVIVIEGRERSGSLITARHALDQGIDVFALPGPISAPTSAGPNRLLWDGAYPALDPAHVLEVLGRSFATPVERAARARAGEASPRRRRGRAQPRPQEPETSAAQSRILRRLQRQPATRDELSRALGLAPEELALDLLELELSERVARDRDGRLRVVSPPRR